MSIETGRIDLLVETADSEIWGIEVKGTSTTTSDIQQVDKYVQDSALDRVFYASNTVERVKAAIDSKGTQFSMNYDEAYRALSGAKYLDQVFNQATVTGIVARNLRDSLPSSERFAF